MYVCPVYMYNVLDKQEFETSMGTKSLVKLSFNIIFHTCNSAIQGVLWYYKLHEVVTNQTCSLCFVQVVLTAGAYLWFLDVSL